MATIPEQLAAAVVDDTLKHAALPGDFIKLPWVSSTGSWSEIDGWLPPGFSSEAAGEGTGGGGGLYFNTEAVKGGNAFTVLSWNAISGALIKERQFSVWLFADVGNTSPDGYQLVAYQNAASEASAKTFVFKLKKWVGGVSTLLGETEATMEQDGSFAIVKVSGKVSVWVKKNEASAFALVGAEVSDEKWIEGYSGIDGNGSNPRLDNFATGTLTVGIPPTVTTEAASSILKSSAKLHGKVNPKGFATNAWFEYGKTTGYGYKSAVKAVGKGSVDVALEEAIEGLKPGTLYHFRIVGENINGRTNGADATFTTTGKKTTRRRKPLLGLDVEIETPDGTYRCPANSKNPRNKPRNISFGTQRGEGFSIASVTFSREIFKDYPDIGLLDTWRFISQAGDVVYEGRLQSTPKTNDPEEEIKINLVGWMGYLNGKQISPLIIDPRLSSWRDPSLQRKINLINGGFALAANVSNGFQDTGVLALGFLLDFTGVVASSTFNEGNEMVFYGGGEDIGHLYFDQIGDTTTTWLKYGALSTDDVWSDYDLSPNYTGSLENAGQGVHATKAGRKYAMFQAFYTNNGYTGQMTNKQIFNNVKVMGNQGLELRGTWPAVGFYLSDIVAYILNNYYPKIKLAGEFNDYLVQFATWHDNALPGYEIIKQLNNLALWETNMWEDRTLYHERADFTKIDWQFKTTDKGVKVNFEGDSIENFANGCSVHYTGFDEIPHNLYPSDHPELRDESEDNPYNKHNEDGWTNCDVPYQCTEAEALQFGRVYLAEFNRPKRPASYTFTSGYIKNAAGHWQGGFDVRNGQTCMPTDKLDDEPRLITVTGWSDDNKELTITVDTPDKLLEAIVARQELARTVKGL